MFLSDFPSFETGPLDSKKRKRIHSSDIHQIPCFQNNGHRIGTTFKALLTQFMIAICQAFSLPVHKDLCIELWHFCYQTRPGKHVESARWRCEEAICRIVHVMGVQQSPIVNHVYCSVCFEIKLFTCIGVKSDHWLFICEIKIVSWNYCFCLDLSK